MSGGEISDKERDCPAVGCAHEYPEMAQGMAWQLFVQRQNVGNGEGGVRGGTPAAGKMGGSRPGGIHGCLS